MARSAGHASRGLYSFTSVYSFFEPRCPRPTGRTRAFVSPRHSPRVCRVHPQALWSPSQGFLGSLPRTLFQVSLGGPRGGLSLSLGWLGRPRHVPLRPPLSPAARGAPGCFYGQAEGLWRPCEGPAPWAADAPIAPECVPGPSRSVRGALHRGSPLRGPSRAFERTCFLQRELAGRLVSPTQDMGSATGCSQD